jgi:hypothetical protein
MIGDQVRTAGRDPLDLWRPDSAQLWGGDEQGVPNSVQAHSWSRFLTGYLFLLAGGNI